MMATGLSGLADAVMCSICLESFVEARVLPCVHSFCTKCLEDLVDEQQMITCPECRQEFHVPNGDVSRLNLNFALNNILGELSRIPSLSESEPLNTNTKFCTLHPESVCELFCRDCSKLICYKCVSHWGTCGQHSYDDITTVVEECRLSVRDWALKKNNSLSRVMKHSSALAEVRDAQTADFLQVTKVITDTFEMYIDSLKSRQEAMLQKAFNIHEKNLADLTLEVDRLSIKQATMESEIGVCNNMICLDDPTQFLQEYNRLKDKQMFMEDRLPEHLVSYFNLSSLYFNANNLLLADVIANFGEISLVGDGANEYQEAEERAPQAERVEERAPQAERPTLQQQQRFTHDFRRPAFARAQSEPVMEQEQATRNIKWTLGPKRGRHNADLKFFDNGFTVRSTSTTSSAIVGKPGIKNGKHSWIFSVSGFPNGFGVGISIGLFGQGTCVMYDSQKAGTMHVQLDCAAKKLSIWPNGARKPDLLCFENPCRWEIHPYFYLSPCNKNTENYIKIASIDGIDIKDDSCCIL